MSDLIWTGTAYKDPNTGQVISRAAIRRTFEESLANLTRRTDGLADDLRAGRISLNEWGDEMRLIVKQTQMAAHELAVGGREQMTQSDYGTVGQKVRTQYQFLENWTRDIGNGGSLQTEGRAKQYLRSARSSYLQLEAEQMGERGFMVRNVTRAGESCAECLAEENRGLVPIGSMSIPGSRVCLGNCRCILVYERAA